MKLVMTSDTHYPFTEDMIPSGDVFLHAGDLMYTGYPDEWYQRLDSLRALEHKNKIFVPGNHDFHVQNYRGVARSELRKAGVFCLDGNDICAEVNGLIVYGIPYVTGLRGWAYAKTEKELEEWLNRATHGMPDPDIVISHQPPFMIRDAVFPERTNKYAQEHVGSVALNRWFHSMKKKPKVWVCGHIHESYGQENIDGTEFFNAAMCDRNYEQNNKPLTWEIN